ncbi:MAG: hypothetical protein JO269_10105 [Burkholderiaceae bacterium]|nr:hypothetical protein [Burkholderiaceae bacterium]
MSTGSLAVATGNMVDVLKHFDAHGNAITSPVGIVATNSQLSLTGGSNAGGGFLATPR